jgi:hypothetical protein
MEYKVPGTDIKIDLEHNLFNAQARGDIDLDIGSGFIAAFGVQELYTMWSQNQYFQMGMEIPVTSLTSDYISQFSLPPGFQGIENLMILLCRAATAVMY